MPSLRLLKLPRRDPDRPTLKQRAAALKAKAARVMGRRASPASPAASPADASDADLLALAARFDEAHATWMVAVEANREPQQRLEAALEAAKARGGPRLKDIEAAWALPGVKEASDADEESFGIVSDLALGILKHSARTVRGLALQARAASVLVWPCGDYQEDAALGLDEDMSERAVRSLIESCCAAAAVGCRGVSVAGSAASTVPDAELLALEAEFLAADAAATAAFDRLDEAENAYAAPAMPVALRVWSHDWISNSIPRPGTMPVGDGTHRQSPYGEREVELLRGRAHTCRVFGGTEGEPHPNGGRIVPNKMAQDRGDAIVSAWDEWQAAISAGRATANLPALETERRDAIRLREAVLWRIREARVHSLVGLGVKARTAAEMAGETDMRKAAARHDPGDSDGLLYALAADVLDMGCKTGAPAHG